MGGPESSLDPLINVLVQQPPSPSMPQLKRNREPSPVSSFTALKDVDQEVETKSEADGSVSEDAVSPTHDVDKASGTICLISTCSIGLIDFQAFRWISGSDVHHDTPVCSLQNV